MKTRLGAAALATDGVARYFTVRSECAIAAKLRMNKS
jgi:hypothetical protein